MPELCTAWITLAVSADNMQRDIKRAFNAVDVDQAGRRAGKQFSDSVAGSTNLSAVERKLAEAGKRGAGLLGTALKGGIATAAVDVGGVIGSALTLGFSRLTAIDDAKAKLRMLGNDAASTAQVMDNALAAVKGTAFGLGDAAGLAGVIVAAGIKPGQELESTLKRVADSAAASGSSLGEMGQIWGKAAAKGKIDGEIADQLLTRQIPIYDILAKKIGTTSGEVSELVSKGKVDFATFSDAMNTALSGAALKTGETVSGAFSNLKAALGRAGAAALEPGFGKLPGTISALTAAVDDATPRIKEFAKAFSAQLFDEWLPKAQQVFDQLRESGDVSRVSDVFASLAGTVTDVLPSILRIGESLGAASAAVGISTWKIFLSTLEAAAGVLKSVAPLIETLAGLMERNQGLVTALVAGWVAFKTVPAILGSVSSAFLPLSTAVGGIGPKLAAMRTGIGGAAESWGTLVGWMKQANPQMSTAQANMALLKNGASGLASGGLGLVKGAAGGLVTALGGPLNIALMGATALFADITAKNAEASAAMEGYRQAAKQTSDTQIALNEALMASSGLMDDAAKAAAGQRVKSAVGELEAASKSNASWLDQFRDSEGSLWGGFKSQIFGGANERNNLAYAKDVRADTARSAKEAIDGLKLSQQDLEEQVQGGLPIFDALVASLEKQGEGGYVAAEKLKQARVAILRAQEAGAVAGPVLAKLGEDVETSAARIKIAFSALPTDVPINVSMDGGQPVYDMLVQLGEKVRVDNDKNIVVDAPLAPEVLNMLEALGFAVRTDNDKLIIVRQDGAEVASEQIDQAAKDRTATITVLTNTLAAAVDAGAALGVGGRADGAIVPMAGGGLRSIRKPDSAGIYAGRGAGTIFAEQETGGEAYIPLAPAKRGRSLRILAEVARLFGLSVMGSGGITVESLKAFAANISGQNYQFGAGNGDTFSTDCSGAQSTIANYLTGGSGRFSTADAAAALTSRGFRQGDPPEGIAAYWIGWRNGGPGGGHTAGTIVDPLGGNVNVEMGGRSGGGQYGGGAAGAGDFPNRAWIAVAGGDDPANSNFGSSAAVQSASASLSSSRAAVTSAQASLQASNDKVDQLKAEGASADEVAVAEARRNTAQEKLAAAEERQSAAETKLSEVKDKAALTAEKRTQSGGDAQGFGQSLVSGLMQGIGLDGSVFSNPLEWPNVKSGLAALNWGGGLLQNIMGQGATQDTAGYAAGGPSMPGLGIPNVADFIKPIGAAAATQPMPDAPHSGGGGAPGPSVVVNGNIGMDPVGFTQRIDAHQNQSFRRNLAAVRP